MKENLMRPVLAFMLTVLLIIPVFAQGEFSEGQTPQNWFLLDPSEDEVQGLSVDKAYQFLSEQGRQVKQVVVAVVDTGVDIDHEDLQGRIWINEDEIEGNGIDDDKNGYVDDRYGWNFIGGKDGNVQEDTHELTREYVRLSKIYDGREESSIKKKERDEYEYYLKMKEKLESNYEKAAAQYEFYYGLYYNLNRYNNLLKAYLDVDTVTMNDLRRISSPDSTVLEARNMIGMIFQQLGEDIDFDALSEDLKYSSEYFGDQVNYTYNVDFDPRPIVGDNYSDPYERYYGNNDVKGHDPNHGTHVSGIIAADRKNGIGIEGIGDHVQIMAIRVVPDGDERDKDVANAIRYAVDNGANIINMSFGKSYSPYKNVVDEAVEYAESKGVLMVHAAGNDGKDNDNTEHFPTRILGNNKVAGNWLEIGASGPGDGLDLVGSFSNYGKNTVDVFAPGVDIYSTTPNNEYESASGTSMAAPVASGVAAILMAYYPELSAYQVKDILMKSSRKFDNLKVKNPGTEELVDFSELSISGGLINAYEAVKMAETMTLQKKN